MGIGVDECSGEMKVVDEGRGGEIEGCGGVEVVEGSVDDGSAFDDRVVVIVCREGVDGAPLGARMKSAANAIQPVYAKLTIVLMSVRSYLQTTHHAPHASQRGCQ